jgi:hypothetical protein
MARIKHEGFHIGRISREPLEKAFVEEWNELAPRTFGYLMDNDDYSPRDAKVAATVIQWLGSHVGQCFLEDVRVRHEKRLAGVEQDSTEEGR